MTESELATILAAHFSKEAGPNRKLTKAGVSVNEQRDYLDRMCVGYSFTFTAEVEVVK
jgi:hypothetical protein